MIRVLLALVAILLLNTPATAQDCAECHKTITPKIVSDWELSKHGENGIQCFACHGNQHTSAEDVAEVELPTPETCNNCHTEKVEQFKKGKHALAWAAMKAMPTTHWLPMALTEVAPIVGGKGGGRPDMAQAGGKDPSKIDAALERAIELLS